MIVVSSLAPSPDGSIALICALLISRLRSCRRVSRLNNSMLNWRNSKKKVTAHRKHNPATGQMRSINASWTHSSGTAILLLTTIERASSQSSSSSAHTHTHWLHLVLVSVGVAIVVIIVVLVNV